MTTDHLKTNGDNLWKAVVVIMKATRKNSPALVFWGGVFVAGWHFVGQKVFAQKIVDLHHKENKPLVELVDTTYYTVMGLNMKIDKWLESQEADSIINDVEKEVAIIKTIDKTRKEKLNTDKKSPLKSKSGGKQ